MCGFVRLSVARAVRSGVLFAGFRWAGWCGGIGCFLGVVLRGCVSLMLNGFDFIDNDNILYSNLARDGLHINTGGARKFASNLSRFIKYC